MIWRAKKTLITGGASFIGSHLADSLVERGATVRIVDNLSSGKLDNISKHIEAGRIEFIEGDLLDTGLAQQVVDDIEVVFHLAANHGGRGYIDLHQAACSTNLALDGIVFRACHRAGIEKVIYASSGCVYPKSLQDNPDEVVYLTEDKVGPPYDADNMYGWAKLMGEMALQAYHLECGMKSVSCRYFTAYGPSEHVNHAIMAMIARSFVDQDPFLVWGNGKQIRNWTYVSDIVEGTILAAEKISDGTAINIGTTERTRVIDAVREVLRYTDKEHLQIQFKPDMPTGPLNRVSGNELSRQLLSWEPRVKFREGLHMTIDWFYSSHDRQDVLETLEHSLTGRSAPTE